MRIIINSQEDCYPSFEELSVLSNKCEIMADGKILIELDEQNFRIAENYDITGQSNDASLAYFIINKHRILASGNLSINNEGDYICDGAFRIFSKINVSTHDYILAGQVDASEKYELNEYMLNSTKKNTKNK